MAKSSLQVYDQPGPSFSYDFSREGANTVFNTWEVVGGQSVTTIISPAPQFPESTVGQFDGCGYKSLILGANGKLYSPPWEEGGNVLVIDPTTDTATLENFNTANLPGNAFVYGFYNYYTGELANNGKIYCPPYFRDTILVLDPASNTSYQIQIPYDGMDPPFYTTAVSGANGLIYCLGRKDCLIINPNDDSYFITTFNGVVPTFSTTVNTFRWTSGVKCLADDKLYFVSRYADYLIVIDTSIGFYGTAERKTFGSAAIQSGQNYTGIANGQDGLLHLSPYGSSNANVYWTTINPITNTATDINITSIVNNGFSSWGAITGNDAGIYSAPESNDYNVNNLKYLYYRNGTVQRSSFNLSLPGVGSTTAKWYGGCMAPNGKIYTLPDMQYYGPSAAPPRNNINRKAILVLDTNGNANQVMGNSKFRDLIKNSYFNKGGA